MVTLEVIAVDHANTNKKITSDNLKSYIEDGVGLKSGQVRVSVSNGSDTYFQCVADGSTDDRAVLLQAFDLAKANMPCAVEFGPGDYAVTGGMEINPPAGSRGLTIKGSGNGPTRFTFAKNDALTGNQFIMFAIKPAVEPTVGDFPNYLKDITVEGINFFDKYPEAHASFSLPSFTGGTGYNISDSLAQASVSPTGGTGFTGTVTAVDGFGAITAFDITSDGQDYHNNDVITFTGGTIPATATVQSEESHAIKLRFTINASIKGCGCENIGDEGFDFNYVNGGILTNCTTLGTPSYGAGAALNVQFSDGVIISNCLLQANQVIGTRSTVAGGGGISAEMVSGITENMDNITISNNTLRDFADAGISLNNSVTTTELSNIVIANNNINNCSNGIEYTASPGAKIKGTLVTSNVIKNVNNGITGSMAQADNQDCVISNNIIQDVVARGILISGTDITIADNNIKNVDNSAIRLGSSSNVVISGGVIDNCGGVGIQTILAPSDGKRVTVDGVQIFNSKSTTQVILNCERVRNCLVHQTTPSHQQVWSANEVTNNSLNGGIGIDGVAYGPGIISGNRIDTEDDLIPNTAIAITGDNDRSIISNNFIKTTNPGSTSRKGIHLETGSLNCVVVGNITVSEVNTDGIVNDGTNNTLSANRLI